MEPGIYGTDGTDPEEASGLLEPEDTLEDLHGVRDVLDTGWSPPERPWAVNDWGTTEAEESAGESLDGRLARELPDSVEDEGDGLGDSSDTDGELLDDEVGDVRAGRPSRPSPADSSASVVPQSSTAHGRSGGDQPVSSTSRTPRGSSRVSSASSSPEASSGSVPSVP